MDLRQAYLEMRRAGEDAFPPPCLDYVFRLIYRLSAAPPGFRQLGAADLCHAFQSHAQSDFGALAPKVMESWRMGSGGDLGRVIFLLSRYRCLTLAPGETMEEYAAAGAFHFQ